MTYKITQQCIDLVEALISEGYEGQAMITNCYASGAESVLQGALVIELCGFCKETLCIVEDVDTGEIIFVGRYDEEYGVEPTVKGIVDCAWGYYQSYKGSGYSRPLEFEELFKKYGYIKQKTIPAKTVWEED